MIKALNDKLENLKSTYVEQANQNVLDLATEFATDLTDVPDQQKLVINYLLHRVQTSRTFDPFQSPITEGESELHGINLAMGKQTKYPKDNPQFVPTNMKNMTTYAKIKEM